SALALEQALSRHTNTRPAPLKPADVVLVVGDGAARAGEPPDGAIVPDDEGKEEHEGRQRPEAADALARVGEAARGDEQHEHDEARVRVAAIGALGGGERLAPGAEPPRV